MTVAVDAVGDGLRVESCAIAELHTVAELQRPGLAVRTRFERLSELGLELLPDGVVTHEHVVDGAELAATGSARQPEPSRDRES